MIGEWSVEGYQFDASEAVIDGHFVGLALDEKNQAALTTTRVESWLNQIRPALDGTSA